MTQCPVPTLMIADEADRQVLGSLPRQAVGMIEPTNKLPSELTATRRSAAGKYPFLFALSFVSLIRMATAPVEIATAGFNRDVNV